ncbi:MAG: Uma2 family endonuclease [Symploca sp. SIO3E6]|nr:Uma2 family endonuclease [Caldora sp. SIO3E6]
MTLSTLKAPIIYPEPDGSPMAESDPNRDYLVYGVESLKLYFQDSSDVYVSGNLWLSYEQGVSDAAVSPDVFVVFGVENRPRRSYKVWEEQGKTPDWVLEVTSGSTRRKDEREKPLIYAQMGVSEYFQYDPSGDYLKPSLKGRRLTQNGYQIITPNSLENGTLVVPSLVLGLELWLFPNGQLRFFNPQQGEFLRTYREERERGDQEQQRAEQEQQRAEQEQQRAEQERQRAEQERQRADILAAKLKELGINPSDLV